MLLVYGIIVNIFALTVRGSTLVVRRQIMEIVLYYLHGQIQTTKVDPRTVRVNSIYNVVRLGFV